MRGGDSKDSSMSQFRAPSGRLSGAWWRKAYVALGGLPRQAPLRQDLYVRSGSRETAGCSASHSRPVNDITCWASSDWTCIRPTLRDVIRQCRRSGLSRPESSETIQHGAREGSSRLERTCDATGSRVDPPSSGLTFGRMLFRRCGESSSSTSRGPSRRSRGDPGRTGPH